MTNVPYAQFCDHIDTIIASDFTQVWLSSETVSYATDRSPGDELVAYGNSFSTKSLARERAKVYGKLLANRGWPVNYEVHDASFTGGYCVVLTRARPFPMKMVGLILLASAIVGLFIGMRVVRKR